MKKQTMWAAAAGVGAVFLAARYMAGKAAQAAEAVNPMNRENIFHEGVNNVGDVFDNGSTDDSFSLGASIWEFLHPYSVKAEKEAIGANYPPETTVRHQ